MIGKEINEFICLKEYISEKDYEEINRLQELCISKDKINLKLELDFKLNSRKNSSHGLKEINKFLYYIDGVLVAYLGISSFGNNIGEINGMTHPKWRRKGLFKKLFTLVVDECKKRSFSKILLLTDNKSNSGSEFIKFIGGNYEVSEYRMKLVNEILLKASSPINLRKAEIYERKEIERQNAIFFYGIDEAENFGELDKYENVASIQEEDLSKTTYMIELQTQVIGKIHIEYNDNSAFIFGFGILPKYRGKGYGKAALMEALNLINLRNIKDIGLDVECKNAAALNLYKLCGFKEESIMDYYLYGN